MRADHGRDAYIGRPLMLHARSRRMRVDHGRDAYIGRPLML
jgi:hypothetical protein